MRVLLADDQKDVRLGLKMLLEQEEDMEVIGESTDLTALLNQVNDLKPDLVLVDWELTNLNLAGIIPILRKLSPCMKIVALSGRPESSTAALSAGVDAFASKGDYPERILEAITGLK